MIVTMKTKEALEACNTAAATAPADDDNVMVMIMNVMVM